MTLPYDTEMLRIALARVISSAGDLYAHNPPDWLRLRLTLIVCECKSLADLLGGEGEAYEHKDDMK